MIAAVACLLIALACQDIERVAAPPRTPTTAHAVAGPPVVLAVTCTLSRNSSTISCAPATARRGPGVSGNVILAPTGTYVQFVPFNLVKDTVKQIWSFDAFLHNLLQQSIGTLNGTTLTGSKIYVTAISATQGTGMVSIINPDGIGNLTAPNQPYFNYNQIVAAGANSLAKLWKVSVPNTVTAVNMDILMSTDFPAEQTVTLVPPDTIPAWVHSDTNVATPTDSSRGNFTKQIVKLRFHQTATLADRQLAVALVNGVVVGGRHNPDGSFGVYYVKVADDGSGSGILAAAKALTALPQVESAIIEVVLQELYLRPNDGGDYTNWKLSPDSADISKKNWSLEMTDAPFAWGCSTGGSTTPIGVVDRGFHAIADLSPNVNTSGAAFSFPNDPAQHGVLTSSIIAAAGNNRMGITGVMWNAKLLATDPAIDSLTPKDYGKAYPDQEGYQVVDLAAAGARVVNLSFGIEYTKVVAGDTVYRAPGARIGDSVTAAGDSAAATSVVTDFMSAVRSEQENLNTKRVPLLVVAAGNFAETGNQHNDDAWWSGFPQIKDSLHDTVVVVGASDQHRHVAWFSGANINHQYVDIMAPGNGVYTLNKNGTVQADSGTSLSAPYVTGAAGLLISFDSTLGSFNPGHGAPELKSLILTGAGNSVDVNGLTRTADGYPFLDLYTALVQAAKRPGAPICGNRVWANDSAIVVQRDTAPEVLDPIGHLSIDSAVAVLEVEHGGKEIGACLGHAPDFSQLSCSPVVAFGAGGWTTTSGSLYQPNGGAAFSFEGRSHEAWAVDTAAQDTIVAVAPLFGGRTVWSITRSIGGGAPTQLAQVAISVAPPQDNFVSYNAMVAYPPRGANIIVATTKLVQPGADGPFFDTTWVYTVAKAGGTPQILMVLPGVQFNGGFAISEDGAELVTTELTDFQQCFYESYSLAVNAPVGGRLLTDHPVSDPELCDAFPTVAPDRVTAAGRRRIAKVR